MEMRFNEDDNFKQYVKESLYLDGGDLFWRTDRPREHFQSDWSYSKWITRYGGTRAGYIKNQDGLNYITVGFGKFHYRAHRLIWMFYKGEWPENQIDHIDGNGLNNAEDNLRDVPAKINAHNHKKQSNNSSGVVGVSYDKARGKYYCYINSGGKRKFLGRYETLEKARKVRDSWQLQNLDFTKRHGK